MTAIKYDGDKVDWSLIPKFATEQVLRVFMFGAKKYSRNNYKAGFNSNRLIAASLRHITSWQDGEDSDPETGISHLAHAVCCLLMLLQNMIDGVSTDGRKE